MPTRVYWDNEEKTIIVREMTDKWTWKDYGQAIQQVHEKLGEVSHTVDIIVDCRETSDLPSGALRNLSTSNKVYPQNVGQQVIVATSYFIELFAKMLRDYMPEKQHMFTYVHTMEEAYRHIATHREKL